MPKKRHSLPTAIAALTVTLIVGCFYPPYDGDEAALGEQQSVWQYLKIYSIYQDRLPGTPGRMTPYDMFDRIHDTLKGARYTEYIDDRPNGGLIFNPNTEFYDPIKISSSTAYFFLPEFSDVALEFFNMSLRELAQYQNIIIDVRDNGGGLLKVTAAIIGELLPYNTQYIKNRYRQYNDNKYAGETVEDVSRTTTRNPALRDKNIAVLINEWSASASEILAAGLKDAANAYLVGDSASYGKGIGQVIIPMDDWHKQLSVTFLEISGLTNKTGDYHRKGIKPDPVPEDIRNYVDAHIPNANQREFIQRVIDAIAEDPDIPQDSIGWYQQKYREEYIRWYREPYYALKQMDRQFAFPTYVDDEDDSGGGEMAKQRATAAQRDAENMGKIAAGAFSARAKARWRPMGAVIIDEKDLPNINPPED